MRLVEEVVRSRAALERVKPGDLVVVPVDRVYLQDGNTPTIARLFQENRFGRVFDRSRITVFFDHGVLSPTAEMSDRLREAERFAQEFGLRISRAGQGISHVVALEEGLYEPGAIVVGADSHTCTGGVVQCLALGMGASDVAAAMVTGETWLRVPETVWITVTGTPHVAARAKDVLLYVLASTEQESFLYRSLQWSGGWLRGLGADGLATVANLTVELGAKCCFLPPHEGGPDGMRDTYPSTEERAGGRVIELDVAGLPPFVARPHSPSAAVPLDDCAGTAVDYVFIGSCTNGRFEDLLDAASVLGEHRVASGVHCVITPASLHIYRRAIEAGLIEQFLDAGAIVTPPGCGACVGTQGTIPASDDVVVATSSRNFRGRMGNPRANIYLSSPLIAAHAAASGHLPDVAAVGG